MRRTRNFLAYGFGISIAVHGLVLPFIHQTPTLAQEEPPPEILVRTRIPTPPPTPRPTPTPTMPPTPPPHNRMQTAAPTSAPMRVVTSKQTSHGGGPTEPANRHTAGDPHGSPDATGTAGPIAPAAATGVPAPTPAATPQPTPTPQTCARPQVPATTVRAVEPETPPLAQQQAISGTVAVVVSLDARSRVIATRIHSSPSVLLNAAALAAARGSEFRTEVKNCEPVAADYIFSVDFTAQ